MRAKRPCQFSFRIPALLLLATSAIEANPTRADDPCRVPGALSRIRARLEADQAETSKIREGFGHKRFYFGGSDSKPSVRIAQKVEEGSALGHRYKLTKGWGRSWMSTFGEGTGNPHFDPRAFIAGTSSETAKIFGFEAVSGRVLIAPSAERLNTGIDIINSSTPRGREHLRIALRFEEVTGKQSVEEYLEAFARRRALPLSVDGDLYVHDLAVHTLAVLIPEKEIAHAQKQTQAVLDWVAFARKNLDPQDARRLKVLERMLNRQVAALDSGTGVFSIVAANKLGFSAYGAGYETLVRGGMSPKQVIEELLLQADFDEKFRELGRSFFALKSGSAGFDQRLNRTPREFLGEVRARRRHFQAVANEGQLRRMHQARRQDELRTQAIRRTVSAAEVMNRKYLDSTPAIRLASKVEEGSPRGARFEAEGTSYLGWASNFGRNDRNPHFDARNFISGTSVDTARFFGFELVSDSRIVLPSPERLNWALDRISAATRPERRHLDALIRFSASDAKQGLEEYLRGFAREAKLPVAAEWDLMVHDLNTHTLAVLLPNDYVRLAQRQTEAVVEWVEYVRKSDLPSSAKSQLEEFFFDQQVSALDSGTGNFTLAMAERNFAFAHRAASDMFIHGGKSPAGLLKSLLERAVQETQDPARKGQVEELLNRFLVLKSSSPELSRGLALPKPADFEGQIKARLRHFEAVARTQ